MIAVSSRETVNQPLHAALQAYPKLIAVARRITGSQSEAEDVVQEVLLSLTAKPLSDEIGQLTPYILRMVRNLATDRVRRLRYERSLFVAEEAGCCAFGYGSPEDHMREEQGYRAFRCAMEAMPERTRNFYEKHYFEGVPQNVLARQAGVSCALVCGLIRDAHSRCLAALSSDIPDQTGKRGPCRADAPLCRKILRN